MFPRLSSNREERLKVWKMLLTVSFMISLLYLCVCPVYIQFLVNLVYGPKWGETSAPEVNKAKKSLVFSLLVVDFVWVLSVINWSKRSR
jgi:hypothetical protein